MSSTADFEPLEGGCSCGAVRYSLLLSPIFVNCCHCTWCQRESGAAFAVNAIIETSNIKLLSKTEPIVIDTPSASGRGQKMHRCPICKVCLWSNYDGMGEVLGAIRVGTLDCPSRCPPRAHIYTSTKQKFVILNHDIPAFEQYYDERCWPKDSFERRNKAFETGG